MFVIRFSPSFPLSLPLSAPRGSFKTKKSNRKMWLRGLRKGLMHVRTRAPRHTGGREVSDGVGGRSQIINMLQFRAGWRKSLGTCCRVVVMFLLPGVEKFMSHFYICSLNNTKLLIDLSDAAFADVLL